MNASDASLRRLTDRIVQAAAAKTPLDIRGGGTKAFYGNAPCGAPLEAGELAGITSYEPTELVVTVLGGTSLMELEQVLAARGQCLPFEPPRFGAGGTVGGMVAGGLAGPGRMAAGPIRDYVLGATLVNGRGELLTFGGQVMKNVAGYDVSRVLAGSWGILGVICEVSLKVMPMPPATKTIWCDADESEGIRRVAGWTRDAVPVTASSWHRGRLTVRLAGAQAAVDTAGRAADCHEMIGAEASRWWSNLRDQHHDFFSLSDEELKAEQRLWRIAVPATAAPLALDGGVLIEWGGAQRWYRGAAPVDAVRASAARAGGHATLVRAADKPPGAFATLQPVLLQLHRRLKRAFDPEGIFNPGRLYAGL